MEYKILTARTLDGKPEPIERSWGINDQIGKYAVDGWLLMGSVKPYAEITGVTPSIRYIATMRRERQKE